MFEPSLPLLQASIHPAIDQVTARLIKESNTPATVYRLALSSNGRANGAVPDTLIVKLAAPGWPDDPLGHLREANFYSDWLPQLFPRQPQVYYAGNEPGTQNNLVIMEDVLPTHWFPERTYCWTMQEMRPVAEAYAHFHAQSGALVSSPDKHKWLFPRHEIRLRKTAAELPAMAGKLVELGIWPAIPGFERLLQRTLEAADYFEAQPAVLIHNDVVPANVALPRAPGEAALLFDWEMLSWGVAEMDLAFMFLQPFRSERYLDRQKVLDWYWQARYQQENSRSGFEWSPDERRARQDYADSLWSLWLVPVAYQMAIKPYPPHSGPRRYWNSMHPVVAEKLLSLTEEVVF